MSASAGPPAAGAADELDALSTKELHDRAVSRAEHHLDFKFLWRLLGVIPGAQAAAGDAGEGEYDVQFSKGLISDALKSGEGKLGEALRPLFIEYLRSHPDAHG